MVVYKLIFEIKHSVLNHQLFFSTKVICSKVSRLYQIISVGDQATTTPEPSTTIPTTEAIPDGSKSAMIPCSL